MEKELLEIFQKCSRNEITPEDAMEQVLSGVSFNATLPDDYEDMKDSFLAFMETSFMMDIKMGQTIGEIVRQTDMAVDKFSENILKKQIFKVKKIDANRFTQYKKQAQTVLTLMNGYTPEQRANFSNEMKTCEELAMIICELTNNI